MHVTMGLAEGLEAFGPEIIGRLFNKLLLFLGQLLEGNVGCLVIITHVDDCGPTERARKCVDAEIWTAQDTRHAWEICYIPMQDK